MHKSFAITWKILEVTILELLPNIDLDSICIYTERILHNNNSGNLVYINSQLTSQLQTTSRKVAIKFLGHLVVYKVILILTTTY